MNKRTRSPNYPAIGLPEALERLQKLWDAIQGQPAPRELVATGLGYSGLHGASATALSALRKYGLLERHGDELKISERGRACLHPQTPEERARAIQMAAVEPELFATLTERFPGGSTNEDLLRNYLLRNNFTPTAAANALLAYRETVELAAREGQDHGKSSSQHDQEADQTIQNPSDRSPSSARPADTTPPTHSVRAGKFLVSMTDEFYVDVEASRLDRTGVTRLMNWLKANRELVPESPEQEDILEEDNQ